MPAARVALPEVTRPHAELHAGGVTGCTLSPAVSPLGWWLRPGSSIRTEVRLSYSGILSLIKEEMRKGVNFLMSLLLG